MKRTMALLRVFLVGVCMGITLPVRSQHLKCFVLTPPEQILVGVKRLAVADFSVTTSYQLEDKKKAHSTADEQYLAEQNKNRFADSGRRLSDMMIAALVEKDRGVREIGAGFLGLGSKEGRSFQEGAFTNVFTVVERNELQRVIDELQLSQSGLLNDSTAAQVGEILGVDAIIAGSVNVSCEERWSTEERKYDGDKKREVSCEHLATSASATMRIIHIETGQVIGSKDSRRAHDQKECKGAMFYDPSAPGAGKKKLLSGLKGGLFNRANESIGGEPATNTVTTPEASVDQCLKDIVNDLANYFAP